MILSAPTPAKAHRRGEALVAAPPLRVLLAYTRGLIGDQGPFVSRRSVRSPSPNRLRRSRVFLYIRDERDRNNIRIRINPWRCATPGYPVVVIAYVLTL